MKTIEQPDVAAELRREANINSLCGSEEWTELLNRAANEIERLRNYAELVAKDLHAELCSCDQCSRALAAFDALGKPRPKRNHWWGIPGEP